MENEIFDTGKELLKLELQSKALKKGSELQDMDISIEWCIDKLIPKDSITLISGKGGIGKTWLNIQLANNISKGLPFMDLVTHQMPVVYIDFENSLPVLVERIRKIGASEVDFWHTTNEIRPPKLDDAEWYLYKHLPEGSLLIFDTLRASQNKDENDSKQMAFIMSRLKELRDMGFTIILLHHTPKANDRIYKGSTAILDLSDHVLSLHKVRKGNYEEVDDDDDSGEHCFRFGTKDKTRYEPFHIFIDFAPEKGFIVAPDPDTESLEAIHQLLGDKGRLIQTEICIFTEKELNIGRKKTRSLLRKGEGKFWVSDKEGVKRYYSSVPLSPTIYKGTEGTKENNTPLQFLQKEKDSLPEYSQSLDSSIFSTVPDTREQKGTEGTNNNNHDEGITGEDWELIS